jgi:hypothetical protein
LQQFLGEVSVTLGAKSYKSGSQEKYLSNCRIFTFSPARVNERGWFWFSAPHGLGSLRSLARQFGFSFPAVFIVRSRLGVRHESMIGWAQRGDAALLGEIVFLLAREQAL